jgi:hypothetical protein
MLESCEHVVCSRCFEAGTLETPSDHRFPIKCLRPACESLVSLTELRKLLSPGRLRMLFDESVKQYTELRPELYPGCRNGNCHSVRPSLNTAEIFTCPGCLTQTCTLKDCGGVPHPGWNCQTRWVWLTYTSAFLYAECGCMLTEYQLEDLTLYSRYDTQYVKVYGRERRASTDCVPVSDDVMERDLRRAST